MNKNLENNLLLVFFVLLIGGLAISPAIENRVIPAVNNYLYGRNEVSSTITPSSVPTPTDESEIQTVDTNSQQTTISPSPTNAPTYSVSGGGEREDHESEFELFGH